MKLKHDANLLRHVIICLAMESSILPGPVAVPPGEINYPAKTISIFYQIFTLISGCCPVISNSDSIGVAFRLMVDVSWDQRH